jgi:hypothetical protein
MQDAQELLGIDRDRHAFRFLTIPLGAVDHGRDLARCPQTIGLVLPPPRPLHRFKSCFHKSYLSFTLLGSASQFVFTFGSATYTNNVDTDVSS